MNKLFEPAKIHTMELKNRFVRSATWTGTADETGTVTEKMIRLAEFLAKGSVGLLISGHCFVSEKGKASVRQKAIYDDRFVDGLARLAEKVHAGGAKTALQLAHAGIFAEESVPKPYIAVSNIGNKSKEEITEVTHDDVFRLVDAFVAAGKRAKRAGFDAVQLHCAHGYLLSQFLSPLFNKRSDEYGGDLEGRTRIHKEIMQGLRAELGDDFPILIKMNCSDFVEGGMNLEDASDAAVMFEKFGCNAVELSGGILRSIKFSPSRMGINSKNKEAYFQNEARTIKKKIKIPLILVGGIRSLSTAETMLNTQAADFISLSRPLIAEPNLIARWKAGNVSPSICKSDNRCFKPGFEGQGIHCALS